MELHSIGIIKSPITSKFGAPRQSGLADIKAKIILAPPYNREEAVRGLENYSHIWLLWEFSHSKEQEWRPTVRPPKLGGNTRLGVFATRSPFRPNPIGLSCVRLLEVELGPNGPVLHISGSDLIDGTPIFDIKPYLPYTDSIRDAEGSFGQELSENRLEVFIPPDLGVLFQDPQGLAEVLSLDPRPGYVHDDERVFGLEYENKNLKFKVQGDKLTVLEVQHDYKK